MTTTHVEPKLDVNENDQPMYKNDKSDVDKQAIVGKYSHELDSRIKVSSSKSDRQAENGNQESMAATVNCELIVACVPMYGSTFNTRLKLLRLDFNEFVLSTYENMQEFVRKVACNRTVFNKSAKLTEYEKKRGYDATTRRRLNKLYTLTRFVLNEIVNKHCTDRGNEETPVHEINRKTKGR